MPAPTAPTLAQVNATLIAQLEASLVTTIPLLPRSFSRVLSRALAGLFILIWKYTGWIALQQFAQTADYGESEVNGQTIRPLVLWGRMIGVGDPFPATQAELQIAVLVTQQIGSLAAGTQLLAPDTGVIYQVTSPVPLNANQVNANIRAVDDDRDQDGAGAIGNRGIATELQFANPLPYISRTALVIDVITTAVDAETEESYRTRVNQRLARRPQGGSRADYQAWGLEVPGLANVWPYASVPGQIQLYVEADTTDANPDGIPTQDQLDAVEQAVQFSPDGTADRAPIGTLILPPLPINRFGIDVTIVSLAADNLDSVKTQIEDELDAYLRTREPFIMGLTVLPARNVILEAEIGGIIAAVSQANGGTFASFSCFKGAVQFSAVPMNPGEMSKLGAVNYS